MKRKLIIIGVLVILFLCFFSLSIMIGSIRFSIGEVFKGLFVKDDSVERLIVFNSRLPRTLVGIMIGISLGLSGAVLQTIMHNNLASPSTIGVTNGAGLVGLICLVAFPKFANILPLATILGALLTSLLIYFLAYKKGSSPIRIILAGLAISALFSAFGDIIKTLYSDRLGDASGFLVGSLNNMVWSDFYLLLPYFSIGVFGLLLLIKYLNVLVLGEDIASGLGVNVELIRFILIMICSILAGSSIAVGGLIGFVGLIVPHIAKLLVGYDYKYLLPTTALLGANLILLCDVIGRVINQPGEVSVSIILALVGAPFFLYLLRRKD